MAELDTILPANWNDDRKKRQLLSNVRTAEGVAHFIQTCRDNVKMKFDHCASYLRQNSILIDNVNAVRMPIRLLHTAQQDKKTQEDVIFLFHTMVKVGRVFNIYAAFQMRSVRESL